LTLKLTAGGHPFNAQDMVACPHLVPEKGEAPTDLPDDGDPNEEVEAPRLCVEVGDP